MYKRIFIVIIALTLGLTSYAQDKVDLTKKPEALPAADFEFPEFIQTKLDNGVTVFIVQDDEQPTFSVRLLVPGGSALDGEKPGISDILTDMLTKGAGNRTALEIAQELDGIGASVRAATTNDYITFSASGLKKHMPKVLEIFSDVVVRPTFPEDEFDKLIPQRLAGLKNDKATPATLANKIADMVTYGQHHPYGRFMTEEILESIEVEDLQAYYNAVIKPNNASIVVVGDVTEDEAVDALNKALKDWKPGQVAQITIPEAQPMPLGVYFINRPSSVQSTIFTSSVGPARFDPDWEIESLAASIMGGGFGSRLFRTLREKYSYTYSPRAVLSSNKYTNRFTCYADVRNSVTDSSIVVIKDLLRDLASNPSSDEEINRIKKYRVGQYLMAFEDPGYVAGLIQNAHFNGIEMQRVKTYHKRFEGYSPYEVQRLANRLMNPDKAFIVVVGAPEVKETLEKFGKIYEYDLDLNPLTGEAAKMESVSLDEEDLIEEYVKAIGGKEAIEAVSSMEVTSKATLNAQGQQIPGTYVQTFKAPGMKTEKLDMGVFVQESWCTGDEAWSKNNQGMKKEEGPELNEAKFNAAMFNNARLLDFGLECEVLGKQRGQIIMKVVNPETKKKKTYYYDEKTYLISKIESEEKTPQGNMVIQVTYSDYQTVDGIKVPGKMEMSNPMFSILFENSYKFNEVVDDRIFTPEM